MWGFYFVVLVCQPERQASDLTHIWGPAGELSEDKDWQRQREANTETQTERGRKRQRDQSNKLNSVSESAQFLINEHSPKEPEMEDLFSFTSPFLLTSYIMS